MDFYFQSECKESILPLSALLLLLVQENKFWTWLPSEKRKICIIKIILVKFKHTLIS